MNRKPLFLFVALICSLYSTAVAESDLNCCAMNETQLNDLRADGGALCPDSSIVLVLSKKCTLCPTGTCRVNSYCYCPEEFLEETRIQADCRDSFDDDWPGSIGDEDRDLRSCSPDYTPNPPSTKSCCEMDKTELNILRGGELCPDFNIVLILSKECNLCPAGTCRVNSYCYCPENFLQTTLIQTDCSDSFGHGWPDSVQEEDLDWQCPDEPTEPPPATSAPGSSNGEGNPQASVPQTETPTPSAGSVESGENASPNGQDTTLGNNEDKAEEEGMPLWEKLAIAAGTIAGVASCIIAAIALRHQYRKS